MNTNDIREHLLSRAPWVDRTRTVDTVKAGDATREVCTVGVGWVSSIENLARYLREAFPALTVHYMDLHARPWTVMAA
jgi:hypothetical protein